MKKAGDSNIEDFKKNGGRVNEHNEKKYHRGPNFPLFAYFIDFFHNKNRRGQ